MTLAKDTLHYGAKVVTINNMGRSSHASFLTDQ